MWKYLKYLAPASAGAGGVLALAYVVADQTVIDMPAPLREAIAVGPAEAQEAEAPAAEEPMVMASLDENPAPSRDGGYGLGRTALETEIAAWDIDIRPDGLGLPVGSGDVWTGDEIWIERCASCHGDFGEAVGRWPVIAGGFGSLDGHDPVKTVGSYWPYASTVWDYVHRAMPFGEAQSLSDDEVYALVAYILYSNDIVGDDFELSNENFADVVMPNAEGFYMDDRAETEYTLFTGEPCMENCKEAVEVTMRAMVLDVTPDDETAAATETAPSEEEVTETASEETVVDEAEPALDPELVAAGEGVFRACRACHAVGANARNGTGPHLNNIMGRPIGGIEGFRYSNAFVDAAAEGRVWTEDELAAFIADPRGTFRGTKMAFRGLGSDEEIAAVIAYLQSAGVE